MDSTAKDDKAPTAVALVAPPNEEAEAAAVAEWLAAAVRGEEVSDFAESFGAVREAIDLRAERDALAAENAVLTAELSEVNAELNKHGAPADQRAHGRIRAWAIAGARKAEEAAESASAALAGARAAAFRKLPPERNSVTRKIPLPIVFEPCAFCGKSQPPGTVDLYATVGMYDDGSLGEIFLKMSKQGSTLSGLMDAFAMACSLALKQGVPVEKLCRKFQNLRFEPAGAAGPELGIVASPIDAAFKWIALRFLPPPAGQ